MPTRSTATSTTACASFAEIRQALASQSRRSALRRADRDRRAQGRSARFRALEGGQARRAVVGVAVGHGPARLAHRVLGDVLAPSRRTGRHPRRRRRPDLPAPRERDRAVRGVTCGRSRSPATGCTTGCSSSAARRCRSRSATWFRSSELIDERRTAAFRVLVLQSHYRAPLTFTEEGLEAASAALTELRAALNPAAVASESRSTRIPASPQATRAEFEAAMDDDFDTPRADRRDFRSCPGHQPFGR